MDLILVLYASVQVRRLHTGSNRQWLVGSICNILDANPTVLGPVPDGVVNENRSSTKFMIFSISLFDIVIKCQIIHSEFSYWLLCPVM